MAKYLFQVSYTAQGAKGLLEGGGSKRRAAAEQAAKSVGGKIESFYFAFGDADAFVIADVPDHASASAVSLAVGASGGAHCKTIVLMTPEEVDQASKKPLTYTGPGRAGRPAPRATADARARNYLAAAWPDTRPGCPALRRSQAKGSTWGGGGSVAWMDEGPIEAFRRRC